MKNKKELINRSYNFEVRATEDEKGKVIEGRPIVYDSMTDLGFCSEIIEAGALDNADLTDVRFLVNHDISKIPLARSRKDNENSTMQLGVDEQGLFIRVYLDIESNTEARNLYSAIQRGDITGMSFMFSIEDELELFLVLWKCRQLHFQLMRTQKYMHVIKAIWRDCVASWRTQNIMEKIWRDLKN